MKKLTKEQVFEALCNTFCTEVEGRDEETRLVYELLVNEDGTIADNIQEADTNFTSGIPYWNYADTPEEFREMGEIDSARESMDWEPFANVVEDLTDQANEWLAEIEEEKEQEDA